MKIVEGRVLGCIVGVLMMAVLPVSFSSKTFWLMSKPALALLIPWIIIIFLAGINIFYMSYLDSQKLR